MKLLQDHFCLKDEAILSVFILFSSLSCSVTAFNLVSKDLALLTRGLLNGYLKEQQGRRTDCLQTPATIDKKLLLMILQQHSGHCLLWGRERSLPIATQSGKNTQNITTNTFQPNAVETP